MVGANFLNRTTYFGLGAFGTITLLTLVDCGDSSVNGGGGVPDSGPSETSTTQDAALPDVVDLLTGHVHRYASLGGTPVNLAAITIVGADGKVAKTVTDSNGFFSAPNVVSPYAIRVQPSDAPQYTTEVFDHLTTKTLNLAVGGPPLGWAQHQLDGTCNLTLPTCPNNSGGGCLITLSLFAQASTTDSIANGGYSSSYMTVPNTYPVQVRWAGLSSKRTIKMAALVVTQATNAYWYTTQTLNVEDGQPFACSPASVPQIANGNSVAASVTYQNVSSNLTRSASIFLDLDNGGFAELNSLPSNFSFTLPGSGISGFSLAGFANDYQTQNGDSARSDTDALPTSSTTAAVTVFGPPAITTPQPNTTASQNGKVSWVDASGGAINHVRLSCTTDGGTSSVSFLTDNKAFSLGTLSNLGYSLTGTCSLSLAAYRPLVDINQSLSGSTPRGMDNFYANETSETSLSFTLAP
jgi:hypothetical protein